MTIEEYGSSIEMVVPSTVQINISADTSIWVHRVVQDFTIWFGGAEILAAGGSYYSKLGIVLENCTHVISYCKDDVLRERMPDVYALACEMCTELSQESVSLIIQGNMVIVKP